MKKFLKTCWAGLSYLVVWAVGIAAFAGAVVGTAWATQFMWFTITLGVVCLVSFVWFIGTFVGDD